MTNEVRHATTPTPDGCRWCGVEHRSHGMSWSASKRWHAYESPTTEQRLARMRAHRKENTTR